MIKRLLLLATLGSLLSGCYMVPMALVGPATSGFSTASLMQSGISTSASYIVKKTTGKSISQHALDSISEDVFKQTYLPNKDEVGLNKKHTKSNKIEKKQ